MLFFLFSATGFSGTLANGKKIAGPRANLHRKSYYPIEPVSSTTLKSSNEINQTNPSRVFTPRRIAVLTGSSILLMVISGGFANLSFMGIFDDGDESMTAKNYRKNKNSFNLALGGWVLTLGLDIIASAGIYGYYKEEKPAMAITSGSLRLVYSAFLGAAISRLFIPNSGSSDSEIYDSFKSFDDIWGLGFIPFGFHLITLGDLFEGEDGSNWIHWGIKSTLILSGLGYIIQHTGRLFAEDPAEFSKKVEPIFILPMIVSEIGLATWFVIKGGKKVREANRPLKLSYGLGIDKLVLGVKYDF